MADFDFDDFGRPDNVAPDDPAEDETSFLGMAILTLVLALLGPAGTAGGGGTLTPAPASDKSGLKGS